MNKKKAAKKKSITHKVECLEPDDLYPDDDNDFDLGLIYGETFDYKEYENHLYVELTIAARMLLNLGDEEDNWKNYTQEDCDKVCGRAAGDIIAGKLKAKDKQDISWVEILEWKRWATESGYEIPEKMEEIFSVNEKDTPKKRRAREITRLTERTYIALRTPSNEPSNSEVYANLHLHDKEEILKGEPDADKIYFQFRGPLLRASFNNTMTRIRKKLSTT